MTERTLTRADLAEAVYEQVGLSRNESATLVEQVLEEMTSALVAGRTVKISSFGTFSVRSKSARVGRNPKTGEEVPITPRTVVTFRPSQLLKDRVEKGRGKPKRGAKPSTAGGRGSPDRSSERNYPKSNRRDAVVSSGVRMERRCSVS